MPTPSLNRDCKLSHLSATGRGSGRAGNPVFCASKLWSKAMIRSLHVFGVDPFTACVQDWSVHCMCSGLIRSLHVFRIDPFTACVQDWSVHCMCSGLIPSLHVFRIDLFTAWVQDWSLHCMCSGFLSHSKFLNSDSNTYKFQRNAVYWDKRQHANVQGHPLYPATKWRTMVKRWKGWKMRWRAKPLVLGWTVSLKQRPVLGRMLAW